MTIAELRELIETLPDELEIVISYPSSRSDSMEYSNDIYAVRSDNCLVIVLNI